MKKNTLIPIAIMLAIIGAAAAYKLWPRIVPWDECSEVYRRYADTPGVNAAYIKDYQVNDTVTVSVTLLEATDSAGWTSLKKDFKIEAILDSIQGRININETTKSMRLAPKKNYNLQNDPIKANNDMIVTLYFNHIICIFHLENDEQYNAIRNKQIKDLNPNY